ncbi:MAG: T9SS C-terminal target domain-containing protein [Ignavibacteriae bacterium]|nr:MAG: T9SS C-terminal target domain-containing protein [Ignavibacteriota bacterium]
MKKIKLLISIFVFLIALVNVYAGGIPFQIANGELNVVPDVMNNFNVLSWDGSVKTFNIDTDSFPVFPGFPKHISGNSIEGSIYCNMDADSDLEIVFCIGYTIQAWNKDGSNVTGWPVTVSSYALEGSPSFGDIDGDGQGEIVATSHGLTSGGFIYAYEKNGTPVTGFPINHGYTSRTPVLADMDNNGSCEIIVNKRLSSAGEVYVYKSDGTILTGWPKPINHVPASSAAVGDVNGDGSPDIIMESYSSLYAWKANGDLLNGFPFMMPNGDVNSYSSPVLADFDADGKKEIVFGTHSLSGGGFVYVLNYNGVVQSGWPKTTSYWIYGPPSVGFIDNDNILDIAVGDQVISGTPVDYIYAWNKNGTPLANFPVGPVNAINNQVSLGDIDNDGFTELIIDDNSTSTSGIGKYLAFNHDGTPAANFPIFTTGATFFVTPSLVDLDGNSTLDLIGAGKEGVNFTNVYVWNLGVSFNVSKIYTPMWQYNTRHNGVYGDVTPVGITSNQNTNPVKFSLCQNYPNPFNPTTIINYQLAKNSDVKLVIFDITGKEIAVLVNEEQITGSYNVEWNASNYASGVYFYSLEAGSFKETKKMILIK